MNERTNEHTNEQADKKTEFCSGRVVQYIFIRNVMKQQREEVSVFISREAIANNNHKEKENASFFKKKKEIKIKKEQKRRISLFVRHFIESTRVVDKKIL